MQRPSLDAEPGFQAGPTAGGWVALVVGGFALTIAGAAMGNQLVMALAVPGPAVPYAAATLGIAGFSLVAATVIMGKLVGVRTQRQWLRAFAAVAAPVAAAVALVALSVRPH